MFRKLFFYISLVCCWCGNCMMNIPCFIQNEQKYQIRKFKFCQNDDAQIKDLLQEFNYTKNNKQGMLKLLLSNTEQNLKLTLCANDGLTLAINLFNVLSTFRLYSKEFEGLQNLNDKCDYFLKRFE